MSPEDGLLHRSVFGGATRVKESSHSGTTSSSMLRGMKESLAGGISSVMRSMRSRSVGGDERSAWLCSVLRVVLMAYV